MSGPYQTPDQAVSLKENYRAAKETLEKIAERDILIFSGNPDELSKEINWKAIKKAAPGQYESGDRTHELVSLWYNAERNAVQRRAKSIKESLTSIGYEQVIIKNPAYMIAQREPNNLKDLISSLEAYVEILDDSPEHFTVYVRHDGDHLDILTDRLLHIQGSRLGKCFYRTTEKDVHEWYESFDKKYENATRKWKRNEYRQLAIDFAGVIGGSASVVFALVSGLLVALPPAFTATLLGAYGLQRSRKKQLNDGIRNYENLVGVVETDNALLEAVKPTAEHKKIMAPKVRVDIGEDEPEYATVPATNKAEAEK